MASRKKTPLDFAQLIASDNPKDRLLAARHADKLTDEQLEVLAADERSCIRHEVLLQTCHRISEKTLLHMLGDPDEEVQWMALKSLRSVVEFPPERLRRFVRSANPKIRWQLADWDNLPEDIVRALAVDTCAEVRASVGWRKDLPRDILDALRSDPDEEVRWTMAAVHRGNDWEALAKDPSIEVRELVAWDAPSLSEETLVRLSSDASFRVRRATLERDDLPEAVTVRNLLSNAKMRQEQAIETLKRVSSHEKLELISRVAEVSPKSAKKALERLARHQAA
jgi:hypothetical protein